MKNQLENGKAPLTSQQIASPLARLAVTLFATFWLTATALSSDLETGIRAYETGDFATALEHLAPLAEQGNAAAQTYYGMLNSWGDVVSQNDETALKWISLAAQAGDAEGECRMGENYAMGIGLDQDYTKAAAWYARAAEQNHAEAQFQLAILVATGIGVRRNDVTALKRYRRAAEQGHPEAQYQVAAAYLEGTGVRPDDIYAYMWGSLAIRNGFEHSGRLLEHASDNMTADELGKAKDLTEACLRKNYKDC